MTQGWKTSREERMESDGSTATKFWIGEVSCGALLHDKVTEVYNNILYTKSLTYELELQTCTGVLCESHKCTV